MSATLSGKICQFPMDFPVARFFRAAAGSDRHENGLEQVMLPDRILRLPEVRAATGLSRSTIYARVRQGRFPAPVPLGGKAVGWLESEIGAWIQQTVAEGRKAG
jgi:prophage regulatory protein